LIILAQLSVNCQSQNDIKIKNTTNHNSGDNIEEILWKQLEKGKKYYYIKSGVESVNDYEEEDMDAATLCIEKLLFSSGFKFPDKSTFNIKIKEIFGRIIDNNSNKKYLYINFFNPCDRTIVYLSNNIIDIQGTFIVKNENFITDFYLIPEIINYQKEYPNLLEKENNLSGKKVYREYGEAKVTYLNEFYDSTVQRKNVQKIISRNKYLFNDDKSQFSWLIYNDRYFMESLVKTFGYTQDKKLLNWVMEKNHDEAYDFISNYVFVKNCQGNLVIREGILKYIEETTTDQQKNYANALRIYSSINILEDLQKVKSEYGKKEQYKLMAYTANTFDYLSMKYKTLGLVSNGRWNILGKYFCSATKEDWEKMMNEFKINNYYNLPHLKEAISYAEQFDSVGAPD
jgi:hypothetical protein